MSSSDRPDDDDEDSARRLGDVAAERARRVRGARRLRGLEAEVEAASRGATLATVVAVATGALAEVSGAIVADSPTKCSVGDGDAAGAMVRRVLAVDGGDALVNGNARMGDDSPVTTRAAPTPSSSELAFLAKRSVTA